MKIVYLMTDLAMGGAEIQVLRMCKYMNLNKHNIVLITMIKPESQLLENEMNNNGVKIYSLDMNKGKASFSAYRKFIDIVKKEKPDVIHSHMVHANFLLRVASPFLHKSIKINTVHGEEEFLGKRKLIYQMSDFLIDYTVCCGKILYEQALNNKIVNKRKLKYVCNGINLEEYQFNEQIRKDIRRKYNIGNRFVWITVGRLSEVKNQSFLLSEFKKVLEEGLDSCLMIVGNGELKDNLIDKAKKLHIEENVLFLGKRQDVSSWLSAADAFVLSSIHEGLPLSLQEAAAVGLPIVSTDVGGCNEIVKSDYNGYLCESNKENSLSVAMIKLQKLDKPNRMLMGINSQNIVKENFDINSIMEKWLDLYNNDKINQ